MTRKITLAHAILRAYGLGVLQKCAGQKVLENIVPTGDRLPQKNASSACFYRTSGNCVLKKYVGHRKENQMKNRRTPPVLLSTLQLRKLCEQAEALKFSNGPNERFWKEVDPSGVHVVSLWFVHRPRLVLWKGVDHPWNFQHGGGKNIRALVLCKIRGESKPAELLCDFDHDAFLALTQNARKLTKAG